MSDASSLSPCYAGKILKVDLGSRRMTTRDTADYAPHFLGGRGLATALYHDLVPAGGGFAHEDNRLIITVGPLCGAPGGLGGSRWGIYGKSPLPAAVADAHGGRDHFCYGNLGGRFGAELRFAGYDGLVVSGKAEAPVILAIADDRVELRPAGELWGRTTKEAMESLRRGAPGRTRCLAIGPAGENRVALATVFADGDASCSGGMGAVMGAKGLKAVTVCGSRRRVPVADREALRRLDRRIRSYQRGNVKVWGLDFMAHGPRTKKAPCFGCMGHCLRVRYRAADGTRGKFMCQSRFFYLNHAWGYYGEDTDVPFFANRLCDEQGLDTWEVQAIIEWLLRCRESGLLPERETGLDLSRVGSLEFIRDLVHAISQRRGFGALLAGGAREAARRRGGQAEQLRLRSDPYDPRYCTVNTLLFPFEPREPIQQLHEAGLVLSQWSSWAKGVPEAHISSRVLRGIAERFWGGAEAGDMTTLEGKALAAKRIQERQLAKECLGLCDWMFPLIDVPHPPQDHASPAHRAASRASESGHVGDPGLEAQILSAVLGPAVAEQDLYRVGERVFNLQRGILLREGHRARRDDVLPRQWHEQPVQTHVADPDLLVPGPRGEITSRLGQRIPRRAFERIRDEYYGLRGWDVPTGLPARPQLAALDLPELAAALDECGLLAERARPAPAATRLAHGLQGGREAVARRWSRLRERLRGRLPSLPSLGLLGLGLLGGGSGFGERLSQETLQAVLEAEQAKFGLPSVRQNFRGWNKTMQYYFPDRDEHWVIRFVDGEATAPERCDAPDPEAEIRYEMDTATLQAMSEGRLSGEQAYLRRRLRIKAPFADMMALQSLNKV
jgi:aldehyde:ferredoxin oxidoreductase